MNIRRSIFWVRENWVGVVLSTLVVVMMGGVMVFGHVEASHNRAQVMRRIENGLAGDFIIREKVGLPDGSRIFEITIDVDDRVLKRFTLDDNDRTASDRYGRAFSKQLEAALAELLRTHPGCELRSSSVVSTRIEEQGGCLSSSTFTLPNGAHVILACRGSQPNP